MTEGQSYEARVPAESEGERLDVFAAQVAGVTRSRAGALIREGRVTVDGAAQEKTGFRLKAGMAVGVEVPAAAPAAARAEDIDLEIVYQDADLAVVYKPSGMVVHPAAGNETGTMVNALLKHLDNLSGIGGEIRPGIVHRIDKDTSGLLVAAKNDFAHQGLSAQLSDHSLCREYLALACGSFREDSGTVDRPVGRHPTDRKRMAVDVKNGKSAVTHWEVLERCRGYTLLCCRLETGRTHQIRVHMASIGHPLLGDGLYGAKCPDRGLEGQCLHARRLQLTHPRTRERMQFEAPTPDYFTGILQKLSSV